MLSIDSAGNHLKVKILKSPEFEKDRTRIKLVQGKKPIWKFDETVGKDTFQYWEVPISEIGTICANFEMKELVLMTPTVKDMFRRFTNLRTPIEDLPRIEKVIDWGTRPPKFEAQEDFIRISEERNRLICALAPGLGKTFCSLHRANLLGFQSMLIVCPKSILVNWRTEVHKTYNQDVLIYHGTKAQRLKLKEKINSAPIIITTYSMMSEVNDYIFDQIILDEAHALSHSSTNAWKDARKLVKNNPTAGIQLLTGTPILHKPKDLWGLVWLLYPELAGEFHVWKAQYEEVVKSFKKRIPRKDRSGRIVRDPDTGEVLTREIEIPLVTRTKNLDELRERVRPFLYRVKTDGLVNFVDTVDVVTVGMTKRQRDLYNSIAENVLLRLEEGDLNIVNALSELTRCQQVSEGCYNIPQAGFNDSGKLDFIMEQIDSTDDKIITWSRFKENTNILGEIYKDTGVTFNGDMSQNQKTLAIWSFQGVDNAKDDAEFSRLARAAKWKFGPGEANQFFGVISGASLGFNLHSGNRQYVITPGWNGNINEQAFARIKRLDQEADECFTTFVVSEDSIDESVLNMVLDNLKTCLHVLDGTGDPSYGQVRELIKKLRHDVQKRKHK